MIQPVRPASTSAAAGDDVVILCPENEIILRQLAPSVKLPLT
jgi:hypothetical protein